MVAGVVVVVVQGWSERYVGRLGAVVVAALALSIADVSRVGADAWVTVVLALLTSISFAFRPLVGRAIVAAAGVQGVIVVIRNLI